MTRFFLLLLCSTCWLGSTTSAVPQFIYTDIDQAAVSVWLAAQRGNSNQIPTYVSALERRWRANRADVVKHLDAYGDPIQLTKMVERSVAEIAKAAEKEDFADLQHYSQRLLWDFGIIRAYHRHDFYPLDHFWPMYLSYVELKAITEDPMLELLEWQELACILEDLTCMVNSYEQVAEENLTRYAPLVDEDAHKQVVNQLYECISNYQDALRTGYQSNLQWPCDQMGESLLTLLSCYSLRVDKIQ